MNKKAIVTLLLLVLAFVCAVHSYNDRYRAVDATTTTTRAEVTTPTTEKFSETETTTVITTTVTETEKHSDTVYDDCDQVNMYHRNSNGNCGSCALAYELNRRGIEARAIEIDGMSTDEAAACFYNGFWSDAFGTKAEMENAMLQYSNARFLICYAWASGAHALNAYTYNGKVYYVDSQQDYMGMVDTDPMDAYLFMRVDNLNINDNIYKYVTIE